jgi:outer membrane protein assembly factor BamB
MHGLRFIVGISALTLVVGFARAEENWAQWRGPDFNGSTSAKNLPEKLSKDEQLWSTPMPGHSNGTPIIFGDHIFTTAQQKDGKLLALCVSKADGKILWK